MLAENHSIPSRDQRSIEQKQVMKKEARIINTLLVNSEGPVHGVTYDGVHVWAATGDHLRAFEPDSGHQVKALPVPAHAGTAFDGHYLFQIADAVIQKIDPFDGRIVATIPAPGAGKDSGLAFADGHLWVGQYQDRQIIKIDAKTGEVKRIIQSTRRVTGVTWVDGELWHGYSSDGDGGLAQIDHGNGQELESLELPGKSVSGLESDGADRFFCGGGSEGVLWVVSRS